MHVGSPKGIVCVPMELCYITPGQNINKKNTGSVVDKIIRSSVTSTDERRQKIMKLFSNIPYDTCSTVQQFGVNIKKTFENIDARVLQPPDISYADGKISRPNRGAWNQSGK